MLRERRIFDCRPPGFKFKGADFLAILPGPDSSRARNSKKHRCTVDLDTHFDCARFNRIKKYQIVRHGSSGHISCLGKDLLVVSGAVGIVMLD